jgi:hypothetical protein
MRKLILLVGTAALAATAPALAEKGGKGGGGQGGGKPNHAQQGGGGGKAHGGGHGGGGHSKPHKAERHSGAAAKPHKAERQAFRTAKPDKAERQAFRDSKPHKAAKPHKLEREAMRGAARQEGRFDAPLYDGGDRRSMALAGQACPPGLARKGNGCLPPGQAKKLFGVGDRLQPAWFSGYDLPGDYRSLYSDSDRYYYRYNDEGYIYRVSSGSNLIDAIIPLLGGGFGVGQPLPSGYDVYNVPYAYRDDYYDTDEHLYRYGDNAIYRVDSGTGMIEGIVALLAGNLNVGQALPSGYDAYNVPYDYRDEYMDNDDHLYRYADGNIYQVDAKTQLVQAIVEMLV